MKEERIKREGGIFSDKTFVLTGALSRFTRQGATELIESEGGKVVSSVSANTDYVLVGDNPGSKYRKALDLHVEIIDQDTFASGGHSANLAVNIAAQGIRIIHR